MGLVQKQSVRFLIISYLGIVLGYINTVLLFTNILTSDQFGLTRLLLSFALVVSQLAQLGSPNIIIRFYPYLLQKILSRGLIISVAGILVSTIILFFFKPLITDLYNDESPLFQEYYYLVIPLFIAIVFSNLFDAYLKTQYKNFIATLSQTVILRLLWMILIISYYYELIDFPLFIILFVLSQYMILVILIFYTKNIGHLKLDLTVTDADQKMYDRIRNFGIFTILSGISAFLINKVDIIMLGSYEGLTAVGVYAIAAYMSTVISVPASSIAKTAQVIISNSFKSGDMQTIDILYKKTAINQLILSGGVYLLILLNYQNLMYFLPSTYELGFIAFLFLGLTRVIDDASGVNGIILINSKYFKIDTYFSFVLLILTVVLNLLLIPTYGLSGAAIATLISILIYNLLKVVYIYKKLNIVPYTKSYLLTCIIIAGIYIAGKSLPFMYNVYWDIGIRSAFVCLLFATFIYYLNVSPDLKDLIKKFFKIR